MSSPSFSLRPPIAMAMVGRGNGWKIDCITGSVIAVSGKVLWNGLVTLQVEHPSIDQASGDKPTNQQKKIPGKFFLGNKGKFPWNFWKFIE